MARRTRTEIRILPRHIEEGMFIRALREGTFARETDGMVWFTVGSFTTEGEQIRVVDTQSIVRRFDNDSVVYLLAADGVEADELLATGVWA